MAFQLLGLTEIEIHQMAITVIARLASIVQTAVNINVEESYDIYEKRRTELRIFVTLIKREFYPFVDFNISRNIYWLSRMTKLTDFQPISTRGWCRTKYKKLLLNRNDNT